MRVWAGLRAWAGSAAGAPRRREVTAAAGCPGSPPSTWSRRIWGPQERMGVEADPEAGQVFVRLAGDGGTRPFSLFVKDGGKATYTLVAVPVDMPSEAILIW